MPRDNEFRQKLEQLINSHSIENGSDTPDFILAEYLDNCLLAYEIALKRREIHYGRRAGAWRQDNNIVIDTDPKDSAD